MEIEIEMEFKQRSIIATLRWGREKERRRVSGSKCKMRQTKRFTYTRALPAAATWVEPRGASHRHRRLARFDALISYLVCCLYLFCRLGERMHPSRMKSCCQQGASDCKLCKLRCAVLRCAAAVFIQWVQIVCPQVFVCWPLAMRQQESVL